MLNIQSLVLHIESIFIIINSIFPQIFVAYQNRVIQQYDLSSHLTNVNIHPRGSIDIELGTPTYIYSNIAEKKKEYLCVGCHNGSIGIYDVESGEMINHYNAHKRSITQIEYVPQLIGYCSSALDNKLIIVDPNRFSPKTVITDSIFIIYYR